MPDFPYRIEPAAADDAEPLRAMQRRSLRALGGSFYPAAVIESFIRQIGTLDDALLAEGHYFLARDAGGAVVASGGWSRLEPGYDRAAAVARPIPAVEPTVRAVYVDPGHARRGLGSAIMRRIEADALGAGAESLGLAATLSGVGLYTALGYHRGRRRTLALPDGTSFPVVEMHKRLTAMAPPDRAA